MNAHRASSAATQFGYAPGEPIASIDDMVQHAYGKISKLANNFKRMAGNAEQDANNLLQSMKIQSSDPEGLIALITETKMAIAFKTPAAGVDGTSCTNKNDPSTNPSSRETDIDIELMMPNCTYLNFPKKLTCTLMIAHQIYYPPIYVSAFLKDQESRYACRTRLQICSRTTRLDNLVALAQERLGVANGNVTDCVNTNQNNSDGMASRLNTVGAGLRRKGQADGRHSERDGRLQEAGSITGWRFIAASHKPAIGPYPEKD
ncbi:hypothetical protein ANN_25326 [Periplaneta americana]|uniref:Uncharacterized protein n=1 Tax=Periplaneta americana TaxID=6978 RepID=A0ABQ8S123_PERAM|nr:hypothetical protein ANN_25326 [Periplaneta americana]